MIVIFLYVTMETNFENESKSEYSMKMEGKQMRA